MENLVQFIEHFGTAKLGDNDVVREEGVAERFLGFQILSIWVLEKFKGNGRVLLTAEEGGEPEGRNGLQGRLHICILVIVAIQNYKGKCV